jgi:hypothetical protein
LRKGHLQCSKKQANSRKTSTLLCSSVPRAKVGALLQGSTPPLHYMM